MSPITFANDDCSNFSCLFAQVNLFKPEDETTRRMLARLLHLLHKMKGATGNEGSTAEAEQPDRGEEEADPEASSDASFSKTKTQRNYRGDYLTFGRQVSVS